MAESSRTRRWLWRTIALAVVAALVVALYPAVRAARTAARRSQRMNNLKQIGLALLNFHDSYKHLPAAVRRDEEGRPLCSWRWHILPYYEAIMLGIDFGAAWDDPVNRPLSCYPFDFCYSKDDGSLASLYTNVVAVSGPGTAFEEGRQCRLEDIDPDTILVVEVARTDILWAEPGDLDVSYLPESITAGPDGAGLHVLFADGSVWFLSTDVPYENLTRFLTIDGAKQHDREQLLGPFAVRRSAW